MRAGVAAGTGVFGGHTLLCKRLSVGNSDWSCCCIIRTLRLGFGSFFFLFFFCSFEQNNEFCILTLEVNLVVPWDDFVVEHTHLFAAKYEER